MIEICPAGPPKLIHPSFDQKLSASRKLGSDGGGAFSKRLTSQLASGGKPTREKYICRHPMFENHQNFVLLATLAQPNHQPSEINL
jgi:hypothetical protein